MLMRLVAALAVLLATSISGACLAQVELRRPGQDSFVTRAVFAQAKLWLLSDAGVLSTIAEGRDERAEIALPEPALDLWLQSGQPVVLTCSRAGCPVWTLRRWTGGAWKVEAELRPEDERYVASRHAGVTTTMLTTRRIVDLRDGMPTATMLSAPLRMLPIASVHLAAESVHVGFNAGEWGGGMQRIDSRTGNVTDIQHNASGELCGGPLNTKCDPVNGIATPPWKPGCVAAAIGLVHFMPRGRIVEACGDKVQELYAKPFAPELSDPRGAQVLRDLGASVAFFGLIARDNALWAVGIDGIHRLGPDGAAQRSPLPTFRQIGGIRVSFELPDVVLVLTDVNQRHSVGGSVPMLVPR